MDIGPRKGRVRLQGQSKLVYRAEARVKEMLQKIRAEQMDEQDAVMITKFVRILIGNFFHSAAQYHLSYLDKLLLLNQNVQC